MLSYTLYFKTQKKMIELYGTISIKLTLTLLVISAVCGINNLINTGIFKILNESPKFMSAVGEVKSAPKPEIKITAEQAEAYLDKLHTTALHDALEGTMSFWLQILFFILSVICLLVTFFIVF